jgi:hypothetical protein
MKFKKNLPILALLFAVVSSFAFRSVEQKNYLALRCTWFRFDGAVGEEHLPNKYANGGTVEPTCGGANKLCAICVKSSEIYTSGPNNGLPMVDDDTTCIYAAIDEALNPNGKHNITIDDDGPPNADIDCAVRLKA